MFFMGSLDTRGLVGNIFALISGIDLVFSHLHAYAENGSPIESVILGNIITAIAGLPFISATFPSTMEWLYLFC